jgi:16S rRNA (guanine527-N7)-methyltransferase
VTAPLGAAAFQAASGVSRETQERLAAYVALLAQWNPRINLVGPRTLEDVWRRHIQDSAQLHPLIPDTARILVDLGSGAGFPGLVLAILGVPEVHLVEADVRKAAFLREAARVTGTAAVIHAQRIETTAPICADVITARALAPLPDLLDHAAKFIAAHSILLFLKGQSAAEELTVAQKAWKMRAMQVPSATDPSGTILRLEGVTRVSHVGTD